MSVLPHTEPACLEDPADGAQEIEPHVRPLAEGLTVARMLPALPRKMVGPFIFMDHMGPARFAEGRGLDVGPHPHLNLATVTYLFEGELLHRDSLGTEQVIASGAVNWMNAGAGIAHSERSPVASRAAGPKLHGLQLWVALPTEFEQAAPSFEHHPAEAIPAVEAPGARVRVLAGAAYGASSPVTVRSRLFYVDAELERGARLELPADFQERAAYVVSGAVAFAGQVPRPGRMRVFREGARVTLEALAPSRVVLLGGDRLDGERYIWWNFVSSSRERIEEAKRAWREDRFARIPGEREARIALPPDIGRPR